MDVGDKIRSLIVKLQETYGKEKLLMFTENRKMIQLETLPKKATEIKSYFNYVVHDRWKNILLINKYYMNKTIFKSSKDTTVCIRHITNINPFQINCTQYQESINLLMEGSAQEKVVTNKK
eukprot:7453927-Ditylum_brightwellii.AAC.1